MGSLGYVECHWCKKVCWNYYIPDGVGGPLCEKCLWEEVGGEDDPFERLKQSIAAQKHYRCAWNNQQYTISEFSDYYGKAAGESLWKLAPHFNSVEEFCKRFTVKTVSSRQIGSFASSLPESSAALFGLWVPGCLLLADVHHLGVGGKLKGSRLVPPAWRSDIWDTAWQIGHAGDKTTVLDFCTQLMGSEDPLANLGRVEMEKELQDFCDWLDGRRTPRELWITPDSERMTGWPCAMSQLHMPCIPCHTPGKCPPCTHP